MARSIIIAVGGPRLTDEMRAAPTTVTIAVHDIEQVSSMESTVSANGKHEVTSSIIDIDGVRYPCAKGTPARGLAGMIHDWRYDVGARYDLLLCVRKQGLISFAGAETESYKAFRGVL